MGLSAGVVIRKRHTPGTWQVPSSSVVAWNLNRGGSAHDRTAAFDRPAYAREGLTTLALEAIDLDQVLPLEQSRCV